MIGFEEALRLLTGAAHQLQPEEVPLEEAHGRVLAAPLAARISSPATDVSMMDGYAVHGADLADLPARLPIAGDSFPGGEPPPPLAPGTCLRIFTGAPLPAGADRVVIQEVVQREGDVALFSAPATDPPFIRRTGSDFRSGETLLPAGTALGPRQLLAAAAGDLALLPVRRRPRVTLIATGDELVPPGSASARPGTIPDSITAGLAALALEWGAEPGPCFRLADHLSELERAAADALADSDLVVVTGGASVGERDHAKAMFEPHGLDLIFSKVRIKPGKPVWFGRAAGRLVLGLPGNPTSALVTARLFLAPLLCALTGRDPAVAFTWRKAALADAVPATGDRETFARARQERDGIRLAQSQDSGAQRTLAGHDLLVRLPAYTPALPAGAAVEMLGF